MTSSDLLSAPLKTVYLFRRDDGYGWTLGAVLIGIFVNTYLFGVTSYQFAVYYTRTFRDPLWIKAVVLSLLLIDVFHSCEMIYVPWFTLIENYNNPMMLGVPTWEFVTTPILDSLAAGITQAFLIHRIFHLRPRYYMLCGVIALLTISNVSLGISVSVVGFTISSIELASSIRYVIIPWTITQAITDILISATLCFIFLQSRTGNRQTDWALKTLLHKSVETGIPAALVAIASLLTYVICGTENNSMFAALTFPHGRIYTLTLMDTLLVRTTLREEMKRTDAQASEIVRDFSTGVGDSQASDSSNLHHIELGLVRVSSPNAFKDRSHHNTVDSIRQT